MFFLHRLGRRESKIVDRLLEGYPSPETMGSFKVSWVPINCGGWSTRYPSFRPFSVCPWTGSTRGLFQGSSPGAFLLPSSGRGFSITGRFSRIILRTERHSSLGLGCIGRELEQVPGFLSYFLNVGFTAPSLCAVLFILDTDLLKVVRQRGIGVLKGRIVAVGTNSTSRRLGSKFYQN